MKVLAPLAISLLLVSGCSSTPESKPEYDEVEVVEYEKCIDAYMGDGNLTTGFSTRELMTFAMSACKDLRPLKK